MLLKSLLCNMCIDFMIMKKYCCPLYHIALHRGAHTYRQIKKKEDCSLVESGKTGLVSQQYKSGKGTTQPQCTLFHEV